MNDATPDDDRDDPVGLLFLAHFASCDFVFATAQALRAAFFSPATQSEAAFRFLTYQHLWLALLYVVADGFKELKLNDPAVEPLISADHLDQLRVFRNGVFHFQKTDRKLVQFHEAEKFNWAQNLHVALYDFFCRELPAAEANLTPRLP